MGLLDLILNNKDIKKLFALFDDRFRFVGGCVRDAILGKQNITDFDIATTLSPDDIINFLEHNGFRYKTVGKKFGTITIICETENVSIEITTLRLDKYCDGRWAEVEFTDDWKLDASRRDFTFNALYLDNQEKLYDYFGGLEDLNNNVVKFIGDASKRIEEDYLRILRYIRFKLRYAKDYKNYDIQNIISNYAHKIKDLSGERIKDEFCKILKYSSVNDFLAQIYFYRLDKSFGFIFNKNITLFNNTQEFDEIFKLVLLIDLEQNNVNIFASILKLSNIYKKHIINLCINVKNDIDPYSIWYYQGNSDCLYFLEYKLLMGININNNLYSIVKNGCVAPKLPIDKKTFLENNNNNYSYLKEIESKWVEFHFSQDLLNNYLSN
jgi:tRNA nucleotidyltransferase/poly(A) polymerase